MKLKKCLKLLAFICLFLPVSSNYASMQYVDDIPQIPTLMIPRYANDQIRRKTGEILTLLFDESKMQEVKNIFEEIEDINDSGEYVIPPLHLACFAGNFAIAKWLVDEMGADCHLKSLEGKIRSPLYYACTMRYVGFIPKHSGSLGIVKWLIEQKGVAIDPEHENDFSPLFAACEDGNYDAAYYLIKNGVDVNFVCNNGLTVPFSPIEFVLRQFSLVGYDDLGIFDIITRPLLFLCGLCCCIKKSDNRVYRQLNILKLLIASGARIEELSKGQAKNLSFIKNLLKQSEALEKAVRELKFLAEEREEEEIEGEEEGEELEVAQDEFALNLDAVKEALQRIEQRILDKNVAIYDKQSAFLYLVTFHRKYPTVLPLKSIQAYCNQILFNNRIFKERQFRPVITFTAQHLLKDKRGCSILTASVIHCPDGSMIPYIIANNFKLYKTNVLHEWLKELKGQRSYWDVLFGRKVTGYEKATNDFIDALEFAKQMKRKKVYKKLLKGPTLMNDLQFEGLVNSLKRKENVNVDDLEEKEDLNVSVESCANILSFMC